MSLMKLEFKTLECLLVHELEDLYDAEGRLVEALPEVAKASSSAELKVAINGHLQVTKQHVQRLEEAFTILGKKAKKRTCAGMKGILAEGEEILKANGDEVVRDAGIIAAAQRVEHYEIAAYGAARTFARELKLAEVASLLNQTLEEEKAADKELTELATTKVNVQARQCV